MEKGAGFEGDNMKKKKTVGDGFVGGFFPVSTTKIAWKSRKRSSTFLSPLCLSPLFLSFLTSLLVSESKGFSFDFGLIPLYMH